MPREPRVLGSELFVDVLGRGNAYMDGGYDVNDAYGPNDDLSQAGIGYVCPHGIACVSGNRREEFCPDCVVKPERPLPDFPGDKEAVTQYCTGCARAAEVLFKLKTFLLALPEATIPRATFVQMTYSDCTRNHVLCEEAKKLVKEIENLRL